MHRMKSWQTVLISTALLAAHGQSPSSGNATTSASDSVLPRQVAVPIGLVNRFFPEVTRETSTGQNLTAVDNPKATRSVIYANSDSSKKVTITVDQYVSSADTSSAYQEAVQKSRMVPGSSQSPRRTSRRARLLEPRPRARRRTSVRGRWMAR